MGKNVIWMEVSKDKYKLPIAIADTAKELSEISGTTIFNVKTQAQRAIKSHKEGRFIKVRLDELPKRDRRHEK